MLQAVFKEKEGLLILQTDYNMLLTSYLNKLPKSQCEFRGETRCWYINPIHKDGLIIFLKRLNYQVTNLDETMPVASDAYSKLGLVSTAIWEVCEAAYRALAKLNHPDNGGNVEVMQNINSAWDEIKTMRGK
jgi:hypothetical protein